MKILERRSFYYFISLAYTLLFFQGYVTFLNPVFSYAGFNINEPRMVNYTFMVYTILVCLAPLYFFRGINTISAFICIFIYYLLYIPIEITYFIDFDGDDLYVAYLQFLFFAGMCLLFYADRVQFKRKIIIPSKIDFFKVIFILSILSTIYMIIKYGGNLKLVSFEDVYEQRFATSQLGSDVFTAYISSWLAYMMVPMCLTYGLFAKKKIYFLVGIIASIVIYMAVASKTALVFPGVIYFLYKILKNKDLKSSFSYVGIVLIVLMFVSLLFDFNIYTSILWMRTLGNSGSLTMHYHYFFENHPYTYYTHINFVNSLFQSYPYGNKSLGVAVGSEYWGEDMNANANFWATDGLAAIGDLGILLSSFLLFIVFVFFNRIGKGYNLFFLVLMLIPYIMFILNTSLFSALLTGGSFFIFLILSFSSTEQNRFIKNT
ncbi:hypothetical protein [Chryseobacterium gleum]|uniref:hypothetical protein n=1 Tax=Chryseobacterium gleum TaxID=250 RepID=UPI001E597124|nr:hypothetical protein [Chryseobacterium gleum]MCD9616540.1 hypothetical protein [Chryseobacterium gleum]MCE4066097.1 hypothetical protein [Chryseobacterium gleum]